MYARAKLLHSRRLTAALAFAAALARAVVASIETEAGHSKYVKVEPFGTRGT
jgi:hypothetical protein